MVMSQRSLLLPVVALLFVSLILMLVGTDMWHAIIWGAVTAVIVAITSRTPGRADHL